MIRRPAGTRTTNDINKKIIGLREEGGAITLSRVLTLVISLRLRRSAGRLHRGGQLRQPRTPVPGDRGGPWRSRRRRAATGRAAARRRRRRRGRGRGAALARRARRPRQQRGAAVPAARHPGGGVVARAGARRCPPRTRWASWRFGGSPMPPTAPTRWRASRAGWRATPPATPTWRGAASPTGARCWPRRSIRRRTSRSPRRWCRACRDEPSLDVLAGWLAARIDGPVQRAVGELKVELVRSSETITLSRPQTGRDRDADPDQQARGTDSVGAQGSQGMPRRGPAQTGRRRDLSRGAAGHRQGAVRMSPIVEKYPDTAALVAAAGDRLVDAITDAIDKRGRAQIVLTGGGTGIGLLKRVGEHGDKIDWSKVHLYWGDDRFVPDDDDERNDKQAREALLDHIDIPAANVHADVGQRRRVRRRPRRRGAGLRAGAGRQRRRRPARAGLRCAPAGHGRRGPHQLAVSRDTRGARDEPAGASVCRTPPSHRRGESR